MAPRTVPVAPFDYVVFGGTGDLALRKLLPALYHRELDGQIPEDARIIAASRGKLNRSQFLTLLADRLRPHIPDDSFNVQVWDTFLQRLHYQPIEALGSEGWEGLAELLAGREDRVRVFYLATGPDLFGPICRNLQRAGLSTAKSRVVLEKPIGHSLASAQEINDAVGAVFDEHQVFRIDHYLGKETVQNLLALRFANTLFEPLWNSAHIDHVQITVAETIGVGSRGGYYDKAGALRDMVQNHILQLLCLIAMEPPVRLEADDLRDEKLKVLRALRPIAGADVGTCTVRGQYTAGVGPEGRVPGYRADIGADGPSDTETFVALKVMVENWRWFGVPFYLRTGKRMQERGSEIVIQFRPVPHSIFPDSAGPLTANRLVIRLQPDEGVRLCLMGKDPGPGGLRLRPAPLNLSFAETFKMRYPDAYERLLMDVVRGNTTLFMRRDEVEAAWTWVEPILEEWELRGAAPLPYTAGSSGPAAAIALIERDGRTWHDEWMTGDYD